MLYFLLKNSFFDPKYIFLSVCNSVDNYESGTLPILEAMACGVVVVGYDVRGVNDAVINRKTGILSDYKNYNKIAESTFFLVNNQIEKNNLSKIRICSLASDCTMLT